MMIRMNKENNESSFKEQLRYDAKIFVVGIIVLLMSICIGASTEHVTIAQYLTNPINNYKVGFFQCLLQSSIGC